MQSDRHTQPDAVEPSYKVGLRILARAIALRVAEGGGPTPGEDGSPKPTGGQRAQAEPPTERKVEPTPVEEPPPRHDD